jgi:glycerophosphoryl diester phosphodiesterase
MINLFAHRGLVTKNSPENSVASLKRACKSGFRDIEFDIWFFDGDFFIKHDQPKKSETNILPNLSDYFFFKNEMKYWLDFKNLDEKNADSFLKLLKEKIDESKINLEQIYFAPFITDYKIAAKIFKKIRKVFGVKAQLIAVCEKLKNADEIRILRNFLTKNKIKFLSIFHLLIDKNFMKIFYDIKIFAWTVNDLKRLKELEKLGITNFATDKITPKKYEGIARLSRSSITRKKKIS